MEKILIYPYSKGYEPYVKSQEIMGNYSVTALVSPRGWGYEGDVITDRQGQEYVVSAEFSEKLNDCTCVWFVADGRLKMPKELLSEKVSEAVKHGKKIIYTRYGDKYYEEMRRLIPAEQCVEMRVNHTEKYTLSPDRTYEIETPVVVVAGMGQDTDKLAVQLTLRRKLMEKGYKVRVISSRREGDWDGVYEMPEFVFNHSVSESGKIIKLNHYVKQIELSERPDVFIVGVPGAILPLDNIDHNEFGILAYEMSFAVPCDAAVLCMTYHPQFEGDYKNLAKDMENRFGFFVAGIHIAAVVADTQQFFEDRKLSYVSIDQEVVDKKVSEIHDDTVWDICNEQDAEKAVLRIIDILSD